ncbi:anaerobic coproporphyrinogen III oxidase [Dongia mobilis]|uniref:Coproporphyrinogen-III oxidase n=1 Tax=Dongia mobilis TaxID=578943 RepID=A0A4R6WMW1_9PROT|nr:oxygen-independent coproporphyrinogen III oxidase [Dongia mobilis]TDQ82233.1 anaerobic coproporphyrinogen III oxidase [Dongia mobilis]
MIDTALIARHDRPVPRYTSYPTAPHFHAGIDQAAYAGWLAALPLGAPVSIYIHVPFCREMCWYCGCNTQITARLQPVAAFADNLVAEIELVGRQILSGPIAKRRRVTSIHFGGGTPNTLAPDDLRRIMMALGHVFDLDSNLDLALELDPRRLDAAFIEAMQDCGATRVSLGVQDFDREVQLAINRLQPYDMVARAVEQLRASGIRAINFDLIYGLPRQSVRSIAHTAQAAAELRPDRVALFGYAHVPWMKANQRLIVEADLPDATLRAQQFEVAVDVLVTHGYEQVGLDHFALPGDGLARALHTRRLRRNFQGYTDDRAETILGLGPSAISATPLGYAQNQTDNSPWAREIRAGRLATARGIALSDEDRRRRALIEEVMCYGTADLTVLPLNAKSELARLAPLIADGLVTLQRGQLALTPRGEPFRRVVAAAFDAYLQPDGQRHSRAI